MENESLTQTVLLIIEPILQSDKQLSEIHFHIP
jgi:hypothetical protein